MKHSTKTYTSDQAAIVQELCRSHDLEPEQISFDGSDLNPIFDYEAVCALSLKLTDIRAIDCEIKRVDPMQHLRSVAACTVILPDGRTRTVEESAEVGEEVNGRTLETKREADGIAQNRAVRRGIRSVGINLYKAHKTWLSNGEATPGTTDYDQRAAVIKQIHALSDELGFSKDEYRDLLAAGYGPRTSSSELDDFELHNFARTLRILRRVQHGRQAQAKAA
ncbi:MAG: hypothetical protein R2682_01845 [Pyrinomonadaceae bacterium]